MRRSLTGKVGEGEGTEGHGASLREKKGKKRGCSPTRHCLASDLRKKLFGAQNKKERKESLDPGKGGLEFKPQTPRRPGYLPPSGGVERKAVVRRLAKSRRGKVIHPEGRQGERSLPTSPKRS